MELMAEVEEWRRANEEVKGALSDLVKATGASAGCLSSFAVWQAHPFADERWHHGSEQGPADMSWVLSSAEEWMSRRRGVWCAQAPLAHHVGKLAPVQDDFKRSWKQAHWTHHGFIHGLDEVVLGHACLTGCASEAPKKVWRALRDTLTARRACMPSRTQVAHVLVSATGRKLSWSDRASTLVKESRWSDFESRLRDWIDDPGAHLMTQGAFGLRLVPMTHEHRQGYLVVIERPDPLRIDWREGLTSLQHQVATLASQCHTVAHIADVMGVSENTIKYHLKNVYARLHISTRTELMGVMDVDMG